MVVSLFIPKGIYCQSGLPANVTSATYTTVQADSNSNSPKHATVVSIKVKSLAGIHKAHVKVVDGSNNEIFTQEYDGRTSMAYSATGGYTLSLKFFSTLNLSTNTVKVQFEDKNQTLGTAFIVAPN